jgi:hypothetical protein
MPSDAMTTIMTMMMSSGSASSSYGGGIKRHLRGVRGCTSDRARGR